LKILHLISSRGLYGAERVAIELCKKMRQYNCESIIGALQNTHNPHVEIADEARKNSIRSVIFSCKGKLDFKVIFSIKSFVKNNDIDIIHCHGYKSNFYGVLAGRKGTPIVTTNHNWLISHWRLRMYRQLDSILMRYFDRIIAVSDGIKTEMQKYAVPEGKIRVIDNGIDMARFHGISSAASVKKELGLGEDITIVGTIGNLGQEKGQKYLLQAARGINQNYKNVKILLVGDGPLQADLMQQAVQLGLSDSIIFTGYRTDIPRLLSIMDIFVLPSLIEGLPMVLLEAMASKKPIIATNVGAIPKVINNDNGILVEPKDVAGLQHAIENLLQNSAMRHKYATAGYETVKANFSSDRMCSKYYELYKEVTI